MGRTQCSANACGQKASMIVGHCNHCKLDFCLKHRLAESHDCSQMVAMQDAAKARNAQTLMDGRVHVRKVSEI